jgi:transcriptional regulator with XRE-family HTH domain
MSNIVHKENSQRAPVLQHVSLNVRRLRNAADLSQTALAEKSGVSRRMLVAIEAGETNVSLATLDRVAEALEVAASMK